MYFHKGGKILSIHKEKTTLLHLYIYLKKNKHQIIILLLWRLKFKKKHESYVDNLINSDCDILRYMYMRTYMLFDIVFIYIHVIKST